jgi:ribosomal protein S2
MLPKVTLSNGKTYFIDAKLNQLRNTKNPHDYIKFDEKGLTVGDWEKVKQQYDRYTRFVTICCARCQKVLFTGTEHQAKGLIIYCVDCPGKGG